MHTVLLYLDSLQNSSYFFTIFLATIVITRLSLLPQKRIVSPKLRGKHVHHYIYGLVLLVIAFHYSNITLYAIGLGLFVDELPLFGTDEWLFSEEDWHWGVYHSPKSLTLLLFSIFLVYMFRDHLLLLL